jgi:hypothetical protein
MSKDFSDAPFVVDGVVIKPKQPWSRAYRAHVAKTLRQVGKGHLSDAEREARYLGWYCETHGVSRSEARRAIMKQREQG